MTKLKRKQLKKVEPERFLSNVMAKHVREIDKGEQLRSSKSGRCK